MSYQIPERLKSITPYSYKKDGFILRLDINESCVQVPEAIKKAILARISELKFTEYPESYANGVRELAALRYGVKKDEIAVANGSDELISFVFGRILRPGDTIISTEMDFSGYDACAQIFSQNIIKVKRGEDMFWSPDDMICAIKEHKPSLVIFSTPSNPVGRVMPKADVIRIIEAASECLVVVDEAYMDFSAEESVVDLIGKYNNLIVFKTLSKAYGLAGIRIGLSFAGAELTRVIHAVRDVYNVNSLSQIAAEEMLKHPEFLENSVNEMRRAIKLMHDGLLKLSKSKSDIVKVYNTDANFLLVKFRDAAAVRDKIAAEGYALRLFSGNLIRISAAPKEHVIKLLELFNDILS